MILFVFKLATTVFIITILALGLGKLLEPENRWEVQDERVRKIRNVLDYIFFYSLITGSTLVVILLLMIVWFI